MHEIDAKPVTLLRRLTETKEKPAHEDTFSIHITQGFPQKTHSKMRSQPQIPKYINVNSVK